MLIATNLYRQPMGLSEIGVVELGLFNTTDCTIKCTHFTELDKYPHDRLLNYYFGGQCMTIRHGITYYARRADDFVNYFRGTLRIGNKAIEIGLEEKSLAVNGNVYEIYFGTKHLLYPFLFQSFIILRFLCYDVFSNGKYFSVAVDRDRIEYWSDDYFIASDKAFALKVDMLAGGV